MTRLLGNVERIEIERRPQADGEWISITRAHFIMAQFSTGLLRELFEGLTPEQMTDLLINLLWPELGPQGVRAQHSIRDYEQETTVRALRAALDVAWHEILAHNSDYDHVTQPATLKYLQSRL